MIDRRDSWLAGVIGLILLLAGAGCSCPPGPQLASSTPSLSPPADISTPQAPPTPEPTTVPEGMALYTDPIAGLTILYPEDWAYEAESDKVYFAESEEALKYSDPSDPILGVKTSSPLEMELQFGSIAGAEDLLNSVLADLRGQEEAEIGEIEAWTFGDVPGVGVKVGWTDARTGTPMRAYVIAAMSEEVAGMGFGTSPEADWSSYEPIFRDMFASLELFPPAP